MPKNRSKESDADLRGALEAFAGHKIEASNQEIEQFIRNLVLPFSSYNFTPPTADLQGDNIGKVVSRNQIIAGRPLICSSGELLDVSSFVVIGDSGSTTLRITDFLCPADLDLRLYSAPINVIATAESQTPAYFTHVIQGIPSPLQPYLENVEVTIFAWDSKGAPASNNPTVHWRCRLQTLTIIQ